MDDCVRLRTREVIRRVRTYRRQRQCRSIAALRILNMVVLSAVISLAARLQSPGNFTVPGGSGAVLLSSGTGGYVLVGAGMFLLGVALTVACTRIRDRGRTPGVKDNTPG